jgi:hypothetical protein
MYSSKLAVLITHCWDIGVPPVVQRFLLLPRLLADVNSNERCGGAGRHADTSPVLGRLDR